MIGPPPIPDAELAVAVRSAAWVEVRALVADRPEPLAAAVALAAAIAERHGGSPEHALALLRDALPRSGELAPALRLEAAAVATTLGADPWRDLSPLLSRHAEAVHRRAATETLREAWETLPLAILRAHRQQRLDKGLRRALDAVLAVRTRSRSAARLLLKGDARDGAALRVALWLVTLDHLTAEEALGTAEALLANGWWREADELLIQPRSVSSGAQRWRFAFLRGRASYRLGRYGEAAAHFDRAIATANDRDERFAASVQRARVAELEGEWSAALGHWETARLAAPREIEGWDGTTRLLAVLARPDDAVARLALAPSRIRSVFGPRLVATLLARGAPEAARAAAARLPSRSPAVAALAVAADAASGRPEAARSRAARLVADRSAGPWRDLALALLPPKTGPPEPQEGGTTDLAALAAIATRFGPEAARRHLAIALAARAQTAALFTGVVPEPTFLALPVRELRRVGLERVAARLFASRFPAATESELAWSVRKLAEWGNPSGALTAGELLWAAIGEVPASLLPDELLPLVVPAELTNGCVAAAVRAGLDPAWLAAVVRRESRFAPTARSAAGALGIAQFVPETARGLGFEPREALDPAIALGAAATELARLRDLYQGRLVPAVAAYNAGDAVVTTWLNLLGEDATEFLLAAAVPYGETARYVRAVYEGVQLFRLLGRTSESDRF